MQFFPDRAFSQPDIERYNRQIAFEYERIRDFLIVHYNKTERAGEFWRIAATSSCRRPDGTLELFRGYGRIVIDKDELFTVQSWLYLFIGQDVRPKATTRSPTT